MDRLPEPRGPMRRLLLAVTLGVGMVGAAPLSAFADESPSPSPEASTETPTPPTPTPDPTSAPDPTPAPTPDSTPAPAAAPTPSLDPSPDPTPPASPTPSPSGPSYTLASLNLYRSSAMVRQYTNYWCVPATVQSIANIVLKTS